MLNGGGVVGEVEKARNCSKSKVRAKAEHSIGVIKRVLGFAKVRCRGLEKNAQRLFMTHWPICSCYAHDCRGHSERSVPGRGNGTSGCYPIRQKSPP